MFKYIYPDKKPQVKNKHWTRINMEQRKYSDLEWRLNLQTLIPRDGSLYISSLYEFVYFLQIYSQESNVSF